MSGKTQLLRRKPQKPSADANVSPVGGLERGGQHGLKPMLRPPSTSSVTIQGSVLPGCYQPTEWLSDGPTCVGWWLCVGKRRPGRNDAEDKSHSLGFSPGTNFSVPLKSPVFFYGRGRAGMLGLRLWANNDNRTLTVEFGSAGASPSRGDVSARRGPGPAEGMSIVRGGVQKTSSYRGWRFTLNRFLCVDCSSVRFARDREGSVA